MASADLVYDLAIAVTALMMMMAASSCYAQCDPPCQNGDCTGKNCECDVGWGGDDCSQAQCYNNCKPNGVCVGPGQCECKTGWTGPTCSLRGRQANANNFQCSPPCKNGGQCESNGVCTCRPGFSGRDCSQQRNTATQQQQQGNSCPANCGENGRCVGNSCQCLPGWSGATCTVQVVEVDEKSPDKNLQYYGTGRAILVTTCVDNSECKAANSYCELFSAACKLGRCMCNAGFVLIGQRCMLGRNYNENCNWRDTICLDNTYCGPSAKCMCNSGYKSGPVNNRCTKNQSNKKYGETCKANTDCYYEMACVNGRCECPPGLISDTDYSCRQIHHNDGCDLDSDCTHLERATCSGGTCKCQGGYQETTITRPTGERNITCSDQKRIERNAICPADSKSVCQEGYACVKCEGEVNSYCLWPTASGPEKNVQQQQAVAQVQSQDTQIKAGATSLMTAATSGSIAFSAIVLALIVNNNY